MSNGKRRIEELNLIEDFLFTEATIDEKTSELLMRLIIERAIGLKVGKLVIEAQKVINGVDYNLLPDMWTIWILPYDPFGSDYMLYSVKNIVEECPEIEYNDGVRKLFLYTRGKKGGTHALKNLLTYMQNSNEENAVDEELRRLHSNVNRLRHSKEIGVKYMQMYEVIKYKVKEEVHKEVRQEELRMSKLMQILLDEARYEDLRRIGTDIEYRKTLLAEYCVN